MGTPRKNELVRGVKLAMVNDKVITAKLVEIGISESSIKGKSASLKLEVYLDWTADKLLELKKKGGGELYGQCEECLAPCALDAPHCPVCGTSNDEVEPPPQEDDEESGIVELQKARGELDEAVVRIKTVLNTANRNYWILGQELLAVHDNRLYLKRTNEGSTDPIYKNFAQFVEAEIGIKAPWARTMMVIARRFTEENIVNLGPEKLRTIASLPQNRHAEFITKAETMSTRELAKAAVQTRNYSSPSILPAEPAAGAEASSEETKPSGLSQGTVAAKAKRDARKAAAESGKGLTAVFQESEFEIPLKQDGKNFTATHPLVNGTVCSYTIVVTGKRRYMQVKIGRV